MEILNDMTPSTLTQMLLGSLLENPAVVEIASQAGSKAIAIVKEHFTFSAFEITNAYQESYGYALVAIRLGVDAPELNLAQQIRYSKITREFAQQIEQHYLQPFAQQQGLTDPNDLSVFRKQTTKNLHYFTKHKDKLFEIPEMTEEDKSALISYQKTLAITDLVLEQMCTIKPVEETLAAFLRYEDLLGQAVLFFFRELLRQDQRLKDTQTALQQAKLCIDVQNLQATIEDFKATQAKYPALSEHIEQQLHALQQWQTHHEPLQRFAARFETWQQEIIAWAKDIYTTFDKIEDEVGETKYLVQEISQKLDKLMERGLSPQVNPRDEFIQYSAQILIDRLQAIVETERKKEQETKRQAEEERFRKKQQETEAKRQAEDEDEKAWQKACEQKTKSAYQAYLNGNTVKKSAAEAKRRVGLHLSPLNPLDYLRLLWWTLVMPQNLKDYREIFGDKDEKCIGNWLVSTLVWLPLWILTLALGLELLPSIANAWSYTEIWWLSKAWSPNVYLWISVVLSGIWLLTGWLGNVDKDWAFIVAFVTAFVMAGNMIVVTVVMMGSVEFVLVFFRLDRRYFLEKWQTKVLLTFFKLDRLYYQKQNKWKLLITISVIAMIMTKVLVDNAWIGLVFVVAVLIIFFGVFLSIKFMAPIIDNGLKTGTPSWIARSAFVLLIMAPFFLIYYCFLGGWRWFV